MSMTNWVKSKLAAAVGITKCPECGSADVEKTDEIGLGGSSTFIQVRPPAVYRCRACGHKWTWDGLPPGART